MTEDGRGRRGERGKGVGRIRRARREGGGSRGVGGRRELGVGRELWISKRSRKRKEKIGAE